MAKNRIRERTKQRPFFMVYHDMLDSDVLDNHYQKLVCVYLKKHCNAENSCYPSANTLSKETKISVSKIKVTLTELEQKGIVTKENRRRPDGGKSSNLYIFNDYEEVWKIKNEEEIKDIVKIKREEVSLSEIPLEELEKEIERRKKKEPVLSAPSKVTDNSDSSTKLTQEKYIVETEKSQDIEQKYSMEWLKKHYEYEQMVEECPEEQETIDNVMQILYEDMNTSAKTLRVGKENKPKETYISKMMKLTSKGILYAIRKYREVTEPIGNVTNYIRTLLYRAEEQRHLDNLNKQAIQNNQYKNDQGGGLPSRSIELERCWGMTKSQARYLNYSQRDYTQEEWDDMEQKLLALSVPT